MVSLFICNGYGGIFPHFHWGHEQDKPIVGSSTHHETLSLATEKAEQFTTPYKKIICMKKELVISRPN